MFNFLENLHNGRSIACLLKWSVVCLLWIQTRIYIISVPLQCCMEYDVNTLRLRQYGCHFPDDIIKLICLNENVSILLKVSLKFVRKVQFNNIPALIKIMVWLQPGDKSLSEPMMVSLLTHICTLCLNELNWRTIKWRPTVHAPSYAIYMDDCSFMH